MTVHYVHTPVSNGEILVRTLECSQSHCSGREEWETTSVKRMVEWVSSYLYDKRGISLKGDDGSVLTWENIQKSIATLIANMQKAGMVIRWEGEIKHYQRDSERFCCTDINSYFRLDTFLKLVQAQTEYPEFSKMESTWGSPDLLTEKMNLVELALTAKGKDLERIDYCIGADLDMYTPTSTLGEPFEPHDPGGKPILACYQVAKAVLLARRRKYTEAADLILEAQLTFIQARALRWTYLINGIAREFKGVQTEIAKREARRDTAVKWFRQEQQRQIELASAIQQFNKETKNALVQFVNFFWLNDPFMKPWNEPWKPGQYAEITGITPMFVVSVQK